VSPNRDFQADPISQTDLVTATVARVDDLPSSKALDREPDFDSVRTSPEEGFDDANVELA